MQHDDILQELIFGRPIAFTAPCDLEELEPFQMDGKVYLSGQAIKKGERGKMYARGWLICDCDAAYSFEECDLIAWNPDKHEVCSADTPNSFIFGYPIAFTAPCDLEELEPFQMDGKVYLSGQAIKKGERISPERSESPKAMP